MTATGAPARRPGEAGTGARRCRASPRPRARAASLNPPPAELMHLTGLCHLGHFSSSFSSVPVCCWYKVLEPSQKTCT
jgi:hypothetical protein